MASVKEMIESLASGTKDLLSNRDTSQDPEWKKRKSEQLLSDFMKQGEEMGQGMAGITSLPGSIEKAAAQKIIGSVPNVEAQTALRETNPEGYKKYLQALESVYGDVSQRAKDLGFGLKTWYHGTKSKDIPSFDINKSGERFSLNEPKKAAWFTDNPDLASSYAMTNPGYEKDLIEKLNNNKKEIFEKIRQNNNAVTDKIKETLFAEQKKQILKNPEKYITPQIQKEFENDILLKMFDKNKTREDLINYITEKNIREVNIDSLSEDLASKYKNELSKNRQTNDLLNANIKDLDQQWNNLQKRSAENHSNVLPVRISNEVESINPKIKTNEFADIQNEAIKQADNKNAPGLILENFKSPISEDINTKFMKGDIAGVFDPTKIRSVHAAFDPRFKDSANIMAGTALGLPMAEALRRKVIETQTPKTEESY